MQQVKEGQVWKSVITGARVEVMYQAVPEWVGVKMLDLNMEKPFVELSSSAFGKTMELVEE